MITVFARRLGNPQRSVYFDTGGGFGGGLSYAEGQYDSALSSGSYSGQTWVKPDWSTGTGTPVDFHKISGSGNTYMVFGYDSETSSDGLFLQTITFFDGSWFEMWFYAPIAYDQFDPSQTNASITGIPFSGNTNSWNSVTDPSWVHVGWTLDPTQPFAQNANDESQIATIFWNGQPLKTYESMGSGNVSAFNFDSFINYPVKLTVGSSIWGRDHWQDRSGIKLGTASKNMVDGWYNGGAPVTLPAGLDVHYNFEAPTGWDSNGPINYTLGTLSSSLGGSNPIFDTTEFV